MKRHTNGSSSTNSKNPSAAARTSSYGDAPGINRIERSISARPCSSQQLDVQLPLAGEVVIDHRRHHPGPGGDLGHRCRLVAAFREHLHGGVEDALSALLGAEAPALDVRDLCLRHSIPNPNSVE